MTINRKIYALNAVIWIGGVYHSVSPEYLQTYLDEYSFRFNRRHEGNQQFNAILERVFERAS